MPATRRGGAATTSATTWPRPRPVGGRGARATHRGGVTAGVRGRSAPAWTTTVRCLTRSRTETAPRVTFTSVPAQVSQRQPGGSAHGGDGGRPRVTKRPWVSRPHNSGRAAPWSSSGDCRAVAQIGALSARTVGVRLPRAWRTTNGPPRMSRSAACRCGRERLSADFPALASIVVPTGTVDASSGGSSVPPGSLTTTLPETVEMVADRPKSAVWQAGGRVAPRPAPSRS